MGHCGFLMPPNYAHLYDMTGLLKKYNKYYKPADELTEKIDLKI